MKFQVLTLFPEMFSDFCSVSIIGRAISAGQITVQLTNFRDFSTDKHRRVDDYPFGGGAGMLIGPQSLFDCFNALDPNRQNFRILLTPGGVPFSTEMAKHLSEKPEIMLLCGHYEGIDERVSEQHIDLEISIGDYVLTGGELAAMVVIDAVSRFLPGVLGNEQSPELESFTNGLLEHPHYTRPADFRGHKVPEVLLNGNHAEIEKWRASKSLEKTSKFRPDLLKKELL